MKIDKTRATQVFVWGRSLGSKKAFTFSCKSFRSRLLRALLPQSHRKTLANQVSQVSLAHSYGFTLAETLITLTILGVVAAITVPMLINKQMESANRTKLKKAMAVYEKALNQMIIDNDVKGDIASALNTTDCTITSPYFKKINGDGCRFQTADKVWWDITNIENPIISLKDEITQDNIELIKTNAENIEKDKTSFSMIGYIDDSGILRINDLGTASDGQTIPTAKNKTYLSKLYDFMENKKENESTKEKKYYEKLYDLVQKSNILECGHTEDECLADSTLCRNCYINRYKSDGTKQWKFIFGDQGTSVGSYNYINGQLTIVREDDSNAIFAKTEFYDNGKIKQLGKYEQRYDETIGRNRNTLVSYSYDEDGNMTGCSIRNVSATIETCGCSEYIYQCPKN